MSARAALLGVLALASWGGCSHPSYQCATSAQCVADGISGTCQPQGFCSFPDPACDSGERYESNAGESLGGTCVSTEPTCGAAGGACCATATPCLGNSSCQAGTCQPCVTDVATGHFFSCALRYDGTVWCTGENDVGELGIGAAGGLPNASWVQVKDATNTLITDATVIGTAGHVACVRREGDDALWCWGDNGSGQVGNDSGSTEPSAVRVSRAGGAPLTGIVEVDGGHSHLCARDGAGGVWCWGYTEDGRMGAGTIVSTSQPVAIPVLVAEMGAPFTGATSLAVGEGHACVTKGTELWCWGENGRGQVGDGTRSAHLVPTRIAGFEASTVAAGRFHTCATKPDGSAWCWGAGNQGRIGNGIGNRDEGTAIDVLSPTPVLTTLGGAPLAGVTSLAAAALTCAVTADGAAQCWGINQYGQTGTGAGSFVPRPVLNADGTPLRGVARIIAKFTRACAFLTTGEIRCWGRNDLGGLGDGTFENSGLAKPIQLTCP